MDVGGKLCLQYLHKLFHRHRNVIGTWGKEIRTESKCWKATWEARNRPERVFVQTSMGLFLLETAKNTQDYVVFNYFLQILKWK